MPCQFLRAVQFFLITGALWPFPAHAKAADQSALRALCEKARSSVDIKAPGMPGFRLSGDVRIWIKKNPVATGRYLLTWTSEGKWKEEIGFNGYRRIRFGNENQFWQIRSSDIESPIVFELEKLLDIGHELKVMEGHELNPAHPEKIDGKEAECIKVSTQTRYKRTLCFDPTSGVLLSSAPQNSSSDVSWEFQREKYSQFEQWNGKNFPGLLQGFNGNRPVIEVQFAQLRPLGNLPPGYFKPPNDASVWAYCPDGDAWKIKDRVVPEYSVSARGRREQGTVIIYAVIEEDGHLSNLHLANSAGTDLDQAAIKAVSQWRYERTGCLGSEGRTEKLIEINFWLNY